MKEFSKFKASKIYINARFEEDKTGLYEFRYKVYDIPSFDFLDSKTIIVEIRDDGPNMA